MADVLAREPVWAGRCLSGGAVEAASRYASSERDEDAAPDQSGAAGDRVQTNSESCRPCDLATALLYAAGVDLCGVGSAAGFARHLRRGLVLRHTANARDRHTHGPRGNPGTRAARRNYQDAAPGADWHCCRDGDIVCGREANRI